MEKGVELTGRERVMQPKLLARLNFPRFYMTERVRAQNGHLMLILPLPLLVAEGRRTQR